MTRQGRFRSARGARPRGHRPHLERLEERLPLSAGQSFTLPAASPVGPAPALLAAGDRSMGWAGQPPAADFLGAGAPAAEPGATGWASENPAGSEGLQGDIRGGVGSPVMIKEGDTYYVFTGGPGINIRRSDDLVHWGRIGQVFEEIPAWARRAIPGATDLWAPDISYFNGRYYLYYSVSTLGSKSSAIGVATNTTLDPSSPDYRWEDQGMVIRSGADTTWNAIDPNIALDQDGTPWLVFGSYWTGIKMRRIDPDTGKLSSEDTTLYPLARRTGGTTAIEAPFITYRDGYYYLFVSFDRQPTTYNIRVGRSTSITGPYVDFDGVPMRQGGGTPVLAGYDHITAPGHNGILRDDNGYDWLVHHYKDANRDGARTLMIRQLVWGPDGWPVVGEPVAGLPPLTQDVTVGTWQQSVNFGVWRDRVFYSNGRIDDPNGPATWTQEGNTLTMRWPRAGGGAWVDIVTLSDDGRWYVGRNQNGTVIRGRRNPWPLSQID